MRRLTAFIASAVVCAALIFIADLLKIEASHSRGIFIGVMSGNTFAFIAFNGIIK